MNPRSLQTVLRTLAAAEPPADDGELLRRFVGGDEAAFAELVRRHGRLVWAVCRHLTRSDAEADDAFQATFLVLLRNAGKVRDPGRLSAWLHGVAYKVCAGARRAAHRRAARERAAAAPERNGSAVPDSAWDRALAAVHEEAGRLPDSLRVPFVLCCLEGKGVTEAAQQLGWKLGTLSGRLTRAKAAILARLDARGLTLGVVAGLGLAAPPADVMAKAAALARAGAAIPNAILQLSQGVIGMTATPFKLLAATVLVGGLGLGVGTNWMPTADAQPPKPSSPKPDPQAEVKRLQAELEKAQRAAREAQRAESDLTELLRYTDALLTAKQKWQAAAPASATARWEYDFVPIPVVDRPTFVKLLQEREERGWEFNGTVPMTAPDKPATVCVFRRPAKGALGQWLMQPTGQWKMMYESSVPEWKVLPPAGQKGTPPAKADDANQIEAEIARLQTRLAIARVKTVAVFKGTDLPLGQAELVEILTRMAKKKFPTGQVEITPEGDGLRVQGDKEAVEWAAALVKKLNEK